MKIFLDTADIDEIRAGIATGLLDGITTNPAKIAQTGKKFIPVLEEICSIFDGPVSAEAVAHDADSMIKKAIEIASVAPNINIKLPMTVEGLVAAKILENEKDIRVNVTMIFSADQALLAMKTGATFISIVLNRLDKINSDSDLLVKQTMMIKENFGFKSEVISASLKTKNHIMSCIRHGSDIATMTGEVFFNMYDHPLTTQGLLEFDEVWKNVQER